MIKFFEDLLKILPTTSRNAECLLRIPTDDPDNYFEYAFIASDLPQIVEAWNKTDHVVTQPQPRVGYNAFTDKGVNIRATPDISGTKIGEFQPGEVFKVVNQINNNF